MRGRTSAPVKAGMILSALLPLSTLTPRSLGSKLYPSLMGEHEAVVLSA